MSTISSRNTGETAVVTGYEPVQIDLLACTGATGVDLFARYAPRTPPMLFCRAGHPITPEQFLDLREAGLQHLFVRTGEFNQFSTQLFESLDSVIQEETLPRTQRFAAVQLAVAAEVDRTLRLIQCEAFVSLAERIGHSLSALLAASEVVPIELFHIARHDAHTFTHVTNVAGYSLLLATQIGINNENELEQIATGAMLHDIGKRLIPARILEKSSRLSDTERELVEFHPQRGYEELVDHREFEFGQLMMVYQHHEHIDGNGYPVGILGDEIHPWAKLLAVVDVFDAITGKRPYRKPLSVSAALECLREKAGSHFDREITECWIMAMKQA
jgi:HD-GYP domain-containing protein (c-di-GMP phosphodiesterase class II)